MAYEKLSHNGVTWVDVTAPTKKDMEQLKEDFPQFHPLALEDCLSLLERPKIDDYDDHLFVVMQFPAWDKSEMISHPKEVDIFVGSGFVVTVHDGKLKPLVRLRAQMQEEEKRERLLSQGASRLMHTIIDRLVDYLFPIITKMDAKIHAIEQNIFSEDTRGIVREISVVRRDLIVVRRILRPQTLVLAALEKMDRPFIREGLDDYFGDILDHLTKVRDIMEENAEVVVALADTIDTLASVRINEVMRVLTVISVIMLPLTLIAGLYGMNIPLPFQGQAWSLVGVLGLMLLISLGMIWYFRHRRWI